MAGTEYRTAKRKRRAASSRHAVKYGERAREAPKKNLRLYHSKIDEAKT